MCGVSVLRGAEQATFTEVVQKRVLSRRWPNFVPFSWLCGGVSSVSVTPMRGGKSSSCHSSARPPPATISGTSSPRSWTGCPNRLRVQSAWPSALAYLRGLDEPTPGGVRLVLCAIDVGLCVVCVSCAYTSASCARPFLSLNASLTLVIISFSAT